MTRRVIKITSYQDYISLLKENNCWINVRSNKRNIGIFSNSYFRVEKFRRRGKKCREHMEPTHNFSQIYANSLVAVGQPVERLSPRLICWAMFPIYTNGACSKLTGVFTARFTSIPRWKRSRNVCRATNKTDPLTLTSACFPPPHFREARKYSI